LKARYDKAKPVPFADMCQIVIFGIQLRQI